VSVEILDRISNTLDNLCPCGAEPRPGSAYCSYDCEPNYRSAHTTSDTDGTQMRWRPDLVTAVDDSDLHELGSNTWYAGRYHARLYQRGMPAASEQAVWHLRLDDGHRYVGLDLDRIGDIDSAEHEQRMAEAWARLERELGDTRRVEADPWADLWSGIRDQYRQMAERYSRMIDEIVLGPTSQSVQAGQAVTYTLTDDWQGQFAPLALTVSPPAGPVAETSLVGNGADLRDLQMRDTGHNSGSPQPPIRVPAEAPLLDGLVAAESLAALRVRARGLRGRAVEYETPNRRQALMYWMYAVPPTIDTRQAIRITSVV
jgi:hypothetical protein